jgi:hypothetical protein
MSLLQPRLSPFPWSGSLKTVPCGRCAFASFTNASRTVAGIVGQAAMTSAKSGATFSSRAKQSAKTAMCSSELCTGSAVTGSSLRSTEPKATGSNPVRCISFISDRVLGLRQLPKIGSEAVKFESSVGTTFELSPAMKRHPDDRCSGLYFDINWRLRGAARRRNQTAWHHTSRSRPGCGKVYSPSADGSVRGSVFQSTIASGPSSLSLWKPSSQVTVRPVYVAMRPRMAVIVA